MILRIQPDEGIALEFAAKRPGPTVKLGNVCMDFAYKSYFDMAPSTGYETLIYDCMIGDATLFQRADNIEAGLAGGAAHPRCLGKAILPRIFQAMLRAGTARPRRTNCWARDGPCLASPRMNEHCRGS